ncbi:aminomethyltransferase [Limimonas halophila]|uniref:aminomethyltransferase n=1 Tax=Limimonas halophila TaxID=1082479 RepID=A0A1G7PSB9_9PROT|nr:glycine cleavage system aminomethyltransferase GcvT [Limimonas halophila]SDF89232.1 aminomethyltransferase [Limimonas halophila]
MADRDESSSLLQTPLSHVHKELGARMVPFAGYEMPVQYPSGIVSEHNHTRVSAGLFDISHMGHIVLRLATSAPDVALERIVPGDIAHLRRGRMRYTLLMSEQGGIHDDLMVARPSTPDLFLVVNAATKAHDAEILRRHLGEEVSVEPQENAGFLALQGPKAADVMARLCPGAAAMDFMDVAHLEVNGASAIVSRSGYTGEDGFEIALASADTEAVFRALLAHEEVEPVGLGARDTLRLEAGLCLYGHDIDTTTTPVEAGLSWTIGRRRREAGDFLGADVVLDQLANGPPRKRVGLLPEGRAPVREGAALYAGDGGVHVGSVTSGGFGPTVNRPVAMGYVDRAHSAWGTGVTADVRGRSRPCTVARPRFVQNGEPAIVTSKQNKS